ncbi:uncharacterized protein LOC110265783 [Arachis ipaensis]|uniref:uncharacterized protein LOC110265783 n=1 Tax=Arachis ipaensis TaxID=130454 RepID=UPI000A2B2999|nr:uncharacterized protein LOC110265783 [Arachis ipaensis]
MGMRKSNIGWCFPEDPVWWTDFVSRGVRCKSSYLCHSLGYRFGGQILSVVGLDANHHIYVIAWAIVKVENTETWRWFLELLHQDLEHYKEYDWCFISDMQKGLISAVKAVMPDVHHRFCVWHLWKNFNKNWKDLQ